MLKRIILFACLLVLLPTTALAHTALKSSTPSDKETVTKPLTEIVLEFNTPIENLSTFTLLDKKGQKVKVDHIAVEDKVLKGTFKKPLPNGEYTVNWKIVGEDGHIIERSFTFTVNAPEEKKLTPTETAEKTPASKDNKQEMKPNKPEPTNNDKNNFMMYLFIGASLVVLLIMTTLLLRRGK
jgi:copper resistance protein C